MADLKSQVEYILNEFIPPGPTRENAIAQLAEWASTEQKEQYWLGVEEGKKQISQQLDARLRAIETTLNTLVRQ